MTRIAELQRRVGAEPDGFWGPKSTRAAQKHLRRMMPDPNPWPRSNQSALRGFYGPPGNEARIVNFVPPVPMRLYDGTQEVRTIRCHERVAESLQRALVGAFEASPEFVRRFFGCYVNRPMRGGSLPSLHAYGAAIDLSASTNRLHQHWPTSADMPIEVMEAFAREGWTAAGAFWSRDAMHFQATAP